MADPFAREGKSTGAQFVSAGQMGRPLRDRSWSLENAVASGYEACTWVYACGEILAKHVRSLHFRVFKTDSAGDQKVIPGHDREHLIESPNKHMTRSELLHGAVIRMCLAGEDFWKIVTVGGSKRIPAELWPMHGDQVDPVPDESEWLARYDVRKKGRPKAESIEPELVAHPKLPHPTKPYRGMPPLRALAKVVDMDTRQVDWNRHLVDNDMAPSGFFYDPNIHNATQRKQAQAEVKAHFSGPLHAREPLVLSGGAKWVPLGITPRELDWIASRKFIVGEICTGMGLLTSRFVLDAQTYDNLATAVRYEWENGALPIAFLIADALTLRLLTREERAQGYSIRPDTSSVAVLKEDIHKAAETFERLVRNLVPPQTAASIVNLAVGDLPEGQSVWRAKNLVPAGDKGKREQGNDA